VLAIVAGLSDAELTEMFDEAAKYAIDVLVEVHDEDELKRALAHGATMLGINNRDLRTFETNLAVTAELLPLVPSNVMVISESGVRSREDVQPLFAAGARGFLIGESLMRSNEKAEMVRVLRGGVPA
jgi:indole-3-glycerol phosphate synthase